MTDRLPTLGHLEGVSGYRVADSAAELNFVPRGKHLILGQRRNRGRSDSLILLGKSIERGALRDLYDSNVWLDVEHPHVVFISGKRGSGKSYDLGIFVEGLALNSASRVTTKDTPITTIFFDTQNQFWTLGAAPDDEIPEDREQLQQLEKWRLDPSALPNVRLLRPRGTPALGAGDAEFAIAPADLSLDDWAGLFELDRFQPMTQLIRSALALTTEEGWTDTSGQRRDPQPSFSVSDLVDCISKSIELSSANDATREAVRWRLESVNDTGVFDTSGLPISELLIPGQVSVLLLRELDDSTKSMVVSVICRRLFGVMGAFHTRRRISRRLHQPAPQDELPEGVWVVIDEAHIVAPSNRVTAARPTLVEYVKRGRDAGLSLLLATQQPSALDAAILSQADLNITHRLVTEPDIDAAVARFPSRLPRSVKHGEQDVSHSADLIRSLDDGQAVVGDAESPRGLLIALRPRVSPHGGREPSVLGDARPT